MILNLKNNILVVFVIIFVLSFSACDSGNKNDDKYVKPLQPVKSSLNKQVEVGQNTPVEKNDNISDIEIKKHVDNFNKQMDISTIINAGSADFLRVDEVLSMTNQNFSNIRRAALVAEKSKNLLGARKIHEVALSKAVDIAESNKAISGVTIDSVKLKDYNSAVNLAEKTKMISKKESNAGAAFATVTLMVGAKAAIREEEYDKARTMLKKIIEMPCSASAKEVALLNYAQSYEKEGRLDEAYTEYKKILPELKGNKNLYTLVKSKLAQMVTTEEHLPIIKDDQREVALNMMREKMKNITGNPTEQIVRSNTYLNLIKQMEK